MTNPFTSWRQWCDLLIPGGFDAVQSALERSFDDAFPGHTDVPAALAGSAAWKGKSRG